MTVLDRKVLYGLVFVALIGLVIAGTVATYRGAFEDTVPVTVQADRAGLTLASGAAVKLRGVEVGSVGSVDIDGDQVLVTLELDSEQVERVPAGVTAQIVPPTAFGAKYVQLTDTRTDTGTDTGARAGPAIRAGDVITADRVTVEVDQAFVNLTKVLDAARPAEVSAALSAVAGAVDARGERIGELITRTDAYLRSFNPSLPALAADLRVADDALDVYTDARADLVRTAVNAGRISDTVVDQQASLRALELSLTSFSQDAETLLRGTRRRLPTTLRLYAPITDVLERYSPELPCTVLGLAAANRLAENAVGGTHPGITTITRIVPGRDPYSYGSDLPQLGETAGPACYGLPHVDPAEAEASARGFRTGPNPYAGPDPTPSERTLTTLTNLLAGGRNQLP
jgi:phospholipid/cholesterol/gamma-HCH transport system substrate-binding protein